MPSTRAAENDARRGTSLLGSLLSSGESSDVIQHVLTQLLDSAKRSGRYGDRGKCPITKEYASPHSQLQTLALTLSRVCSTWDDAVCTLLHGGAAICLQPRELRVMKCKAHAIDLTGMHDEFVRELEEKLGGQTVSVPSGYDEEDDDVTIEQLPFLQTLYDDVFGGKKRFLRAVDAEYKKFLVVKAVETLVRDRVDALAFGSTGESLTEMESEAMTPKKPTSAIQFMVASRTYAVGDETVKRFVEDWNALSDADRASFAELAKRDKERYTAECAAASPHSFIEELAKPLNPKEANELGLLGKSPFVVRCQPTRILDLMWHVHMTFPRKYSTACTDLIGAVIDHNPGYRNPEGEGSSKLVAKLDAVYATERKWKNYPYDLGWMISNRTIQAFCWQLEESYAEAFFGEPGCG